MINICFKVFPGFITPYMILTVVLPKAMFYLSGIISDCKSVCVFLGYITPYIMGVLLGRTGGFLLLTVLMMSLMSTGSGEVMSVSSIVVYDIYKTYINPFRYFVHDLRMNNTVSGELLQCLNI